MPGAAGTAVANIRNATFGMSAGTAVCTNAGMAASTDETAESTESAVSTIWMVIVTTDIVTALNKKMKGAKG